MLENYPTLSPEGIRSCLWYAGQVIGNEHVYPVAGYKSMRLLADEHIPRMLVDRLKADGHDITWIALTAPGAIDEEVLSMVIPHPDAGSI